MNRLIKKVLKEFGYDSETWLKRLEILYGKYGLYKHENGDITHFPKRETRITLAYLLSIKHDFVEALERMEKLVNEQNKQNIHDLIELNKQLQENAVRSYKKGYNQALKDVEKLFAYDSVHQIAGYYLLKYDKWEKLKAKGD